jgi:hypothetical protein
MTFKNMKNSKILTTIITSFAIGFILLSPTTTLPSINAQQQSLANITPDHDCIDKIDKSMHSEASLLDVEKAKSLATSHNDFKKMIQGHTPKFESMFTMHSIDTTKCSATLDSLGVAFSLSDTTNSVKHVIVVQENKEITNVMNVTEQEPRNNPNQSPATWSAYEMYGSSTPWTVPVYEAYASWHVPSVSSPWSNACLFTHCDVSVWPGLVNNPGGGPSGSAYIAQAGTDSGVYCTAGCSTFYSAWYEFYPNSLVTLPLTVNPSDSITTDVYSQGKTGGNPNLYNISVMDLTTGKASGVTNFNFSQMGTPYFADYVNERPSFGGTPARLPQFTSDSITGYMYSGGAFQSIWNPYSHGWDNQYIMNNGQGNNISLGSVIGLNGPFTETWLTSAGT